MYEAPGESHTLVAYESDEPMAKVDEQGIIEDYDVIVPTAQNQINSENDLKDYFNENLDKDEETLRVHAESTVRAYDPCMSCATNS